jgi:molybdopterin molybdotransferase
MFDMAALLSLADAQAAVLSRARALEEEEVDLDRAERRYLARDAAALVDLPPFDSSAMDGFALRSADTPGRLRVCAHVAAGRPAERALVRGEAFGIATGGVVPDGADAVIPIEYVVNHGNDIEVVEAVPPGASLRPRGGDVRAGAPVLGAGARIGPAQVGALAAGGLGRVWCRRRPIAAVLTTGTELQAPGRPLSAGQVYEANGAMLAAQLRAAGAHVEQLPPIADDEEAHRQALARGLGHDVLVTSGGVSVGPHDLVRRAAADLGVEEVFWGVAVKPGKPVSFGVGAGTLVFGLPGNPVSALVSFELFVAPALRALQGAAEPLPAWQHGVLASPYKRHAGRDELVRARLVADDSSTLLEPVSGQDSHMIARAAGADALALVPRGEGTLAAGEPVRFLHLS